MQSNDPCHHAFVKFQSRKHEELESTGIRNILARKLREFIQIPLYFIDMTACYHLATSRLQSLNLRGRCLTDHARTVSVEKRTSFNSETMAQQVGDGKVKVCACLPPINVHSMDIIVQQVNKSIIACYK